MRKVVLSAGRPAATSYEYSEKRLAKLKYSPDFRITLSQGSPQTSGFPGCSSDSLFLQVRPQMNCSYPGVPMRTLCMKKSVYVQTFLVGSLAICQKYERIQHWIFLANSSYSLQ